MVLEADVLVQKRGKYLKKRPFSKRHDGSKKGLLQKQVVNKKGRNGGRRSNKSGKGSTGKQESLLLGAISRLYGKAARIFKNWIGKNKISLVSGKNFRLHTATFVAAAAALAAAGFMLHHYYGDGLIAASEEIQLPGESSIVTEMLHYVSPEGEAIGSGEAGIADIPIVDKVKTFSYTIKSGDTLSGIAAEYDLDVGTLISFNDIEDVRRVMEGADLTIPDIDGIPYTVKRGDTLEMIAARYKIPMANLLDANDLQSALIQPGETLFVPGGEINEYEYKKAMGTLFVYPSSGRLTSGYGYRNDPFTGIRRMHYGIDLAGPLGTSIKATMAGTVASAGNQPRGYGKYVVVQHPHGFQSLYGHLSTIYVRKGESIRQGQKLGEMGSTGRSTGSHLHFSLYKNNVPVNPLNGYLYQ